jgi:hypothetical protein
MWVTLPHQFVSQIAFAIQRVNQQIDVSGQINGHRIDGKIAVVQICQQIIAPEARHINHEAAIGCINQHTTYIAFRIQYKKIAPQGVRNPACQWNGILRNRQIKIGQLAFQQRIPHSPADNVDRLRILSQYVLQPLYEVRPSQRTMGFTRG